MSPDHLGNAEDAVLTLTGAGFDSTTTVSLMAAGGTTYQANQMQLDLPTQLSATFTAGSVPAGVYSVVVTRADGTSATLPNAFTMDQGGRVPFPRQPGVPSTLGYHIASTLYLQYSNTGDLAMPAPILEVTIFQTHANGTTDQKALLTLDSSLATQGLWTRQPCPPASATRSRSWPAARRRACWSRANRSRCRSTMPAGNSPGTSAYPDFDPEVGIEDTTDTTPIPWSTLQANFQPPNISTAAWNAMFPNLEAQVGNTWGGFVQRMDNDASYLGHLGENVTDLSQFWSFEVQQANGFSRGPDAVLTTPTRQSRHPGRR